MEWLNKVGQRNIAKYLIAISVIIALIIFGLKLAGFGASKTTLINVVMGVILFSLPNILFSITAHKSRQYRLFSLFVSSIVVVLNSCLFTLSLFFVNLSSFLFILSLVEIILSIGFLIFVIHSEKLKGKTKKNRTLDTNEKNESSPERL